MHDAVHLEGLRCDGSAHGGCQAGCLLFWKEVWLERVRGREGEPPPSAEATVAQVREKLLPGTRESRGSAGGQDLFRCQATELLRATSPLSAWDPRPYLRDIWTRNVPLREFVWVLAQALVDHVPIRVKVVCRRKQPTHTPARRHSFPDLTAAVA
jgi:hypothetical protein